MLYLLVPIVSTEWREMRLFTTFSAVEQVVAAGIAERQANGVPDRWCYVIAYDGTDEVFPVWGYVIYEGYLQRFAITPSPSESLHLPQ
jgi:hypothetical protein